MRGKRKGRGGVRKGPQAADLPSDSPKRKDSRLEYQSPCLSHASPPITNFFHPQSKEHCSVEAGENTKKNEAADEPFSPLEKISAENTVPEEGSQSECISGNLAQKSHENGVELAVEDSQRPQSPATPHKMILIQEPQPQTQSQPPILSPSSALSQLTIANGALKKATKSRRKLNPNQTANQLTPATNGSKLNCCTKPRAAVTEGKSSSTAATNNGSQHKLTEYFPVRRSVRKTKKTVLEERQRTLEEAVTMCKEEGLEIHNFEGKGRGIVARRHFGKGEFVVEYAGELIKVEEAKEREKLYAQDQNTGCYMYYFKYRNQQYCVDATPESSRLGRLVNHSRNGNLLTKTITVDNNPRLVLIAKEDIQPGEEVTYDYGDRSKESLKYHPWLAS